ncbi:hypothetical protein DJ010_08470 [Nocardioides silvaticus]|uniref:PASTA domain-containing protein n=1 Tax=Nocardioides silvaticus TaxID=2201891 RepID=A0A316TH82_9ACTN|nr:Stk1 family PASTA domain-containing Ser/Thr kinase [Nocardioides silvaticus]PWN03148.1 hypothetical protein DJ010_08470 [Nocardioides silvaticus]
MPTDRSDRTDHPTEDDARALLARAAATIDVDDSAPMMLTGLPEPRHRRWPVLAAAAAVVLAIGGGLLVAQQLGGDDTVPAPTAESDGPSDVAGPPTDDVLPSLLGYTEEEAIELLQDRGNPISVHVAPDGCNAAGIVTGTRPAGGALAPPGEPVTITVVGEQQVVDCVGEPPWDRIWGVVRSAQGLDVAPAELDGIEVGSDVRDALVQMLAEEQSGRPRVMARWTYDDARCGGHVPGFDRLEIWVGDSAQECPSTSVFLHFGDDGRLIAVETGEITERQLGAGLNRLSSATQFIAWARGDGPAPDFADRVRVMFLGGGAFGHTGWTDRPEDRTSYAGCSGLGFPDCALDPVALLVRHVVPVAPAAGRSQCADGGQVPQRFADASADVVRLESSSSAHCQQWAVELWIDEEGEIYGVNQAGSH